MNAFFHVFIFLFSITPYKLTYAESTPSEIREYKECLGDLWSKDHPYTKGHENDNKNKTPIISSYNPNDSDTPSYNIKERLIGKGVTSITDIVILEQMRN